MIEYITVTNECGLTLTVCSEIDYCNVNYNSICGGLSLPVNWAGYIRLYKDDMAPHFNLIKKAIQELSWVGKKADELANEAYFSFSDGTALGFTWRAWGDMMDAIVGDREGYMAYYM